MAPAPIDDGVEDAWMGEALAEAALALEHDDVPVGAVVVELSTGEIVARAHNTRERDHDPTAHAEVLALRAAAAARRDLAADRPRARRDARAVPDVRGRGVGGAHRTRLVFGAADPKAGAAGSLYNFAADPRLNHDIEVVAGVRAAGVRRAAHRRSSDRDAERPIPYYLAPEGCESGRIGWSRKPLWRKSPWVQIPLPPLCEEALACGQGFCVECRVDVSRIRAGRDALSYEWGSQASIDISVGTVEHFEAANARERDFSAFVAAVEPLRHALAARFGAERGAEAYCEALAYAWQHWERVREIEKPIAYLFTVGRSRTRRLVPVRVSFPAPSAATGERQIEPKLARALERLSGRQRTAVVLVVAFGWSYAEVAEVMRVTKATVQRHVDRAMVALRRELGVEDPDDR